MREEKTNKKLMVTMTNLTPDDRDAKMRTINCSCIGLYLQLSDIPCLYSDQCPSDTHTCACVSEG